MGEVLLLFAGCWQRDTAVFFMSPKLPRNCPSQLRRLAERVRSFQERENGVPKEQRAQRDGCESTRKRFAGSESTDRRIHLRLA